MKLMVKVHKAYRRIIAVCDKELLGKKFVEGKMQLDVAKDFYDGEEMEEIKVINLLKREKEDDSTFNLVGKYSVEAGKKAGIVSNEKGAVLSVQKIPFALSLI